jgi:hypothetical protein
MREFSKDYLFKVSIKPERGYGHFEKKKKPYYVVAANKKEAESRLQLRDGWVISSITLLGEQISGVMFGGNQVT